MKMLRLLVLAAALMVTSTLHAQLLPQNQPRTRYLIKMQGATVRKTRDISHYLSKQGLDVAGHNFQKRTVEVVLTPAEAQAFQKRFGNRAILVRVDSAHELDERYLNPASLAARMKALADQFPKQAKLHNMGNSLEGRPMLALEISNPGPELKPSIIVDGMHHAREVMTPEIALDVAETLLQAQRSARAPAWMRRAANDLMSRARIFVVPMVNPDGNNIVWTSNNMWRKNARGDGRDIFGVDINRNYPFQWGKCQGSSSNKRNETYRGESGGSEPETKALIALGDATKPVLYLSYHSYSELVLAPYGCDGQYTAEQPLLTAFGKKLAGLLPVDEGKGTYTYGTSWEVLYAVDGASVDYFYAAYGAMSYVLEVNQDFQPDYSLRAPTLAKHRIAWMSTMTDVLNATQLIRVSAGGKPVAAKIEFAQIQPKAGERPFSTNDQGYLFKVLAPGAYKVRATAANGQSATVDATVGNDSGIIDIKL